MMNYKKLFLLSAALFALGCAHSPVYRVTPSGTEKDFYMGRELVSNDAGNVKTILNFEQQRGENFEFFLAAINKGVASCIFYPEDCYEEVVESYGEAESSQTRYMINAVNPEIQLKYFDKKISRVNAQKKTYETASCIFSLFNFAGDVSNLGNKRSIKEIEEERVKREEQEHLYAQTEAEYQNTLLQLEESRQFWQNKALRKTTLYKDEKIGGLILFPVVHDAKLIKVVIPVGNTVHSYFFEQQRIN